MKKKADPNTNFAKRSRGLCHTSDFCRKHQLIVEQLDDRKFRLLDWRTALPVGKERELAFYKDLVRDMYFILPDDQMPADELCPAPIPN